MPRVFRFGVIGYGNMASAIVGGAHRNGTFLPSDTFVFDKNPDSLLAAATRGMNVSNSIEELVDLEYGKEYRDFYKGLAAFRHNNSALAAGANVAPVVFVEEAPEAVLAFTRENEENKVLCIFNFSAEPQTLTITESAAGAYNCLCGETREYNAGDVVELEPWGYMLLNK